MESVLLPPRFSRNFSGGQSLQGLLYASLNHCFSWGERSGRVMQWTLLQSSCLASLSTTCPSVGGSSTIYPSSSFHSGGSEVVTLLSVGCTDVVLHLKLSLHQKKHPKVHFTKLSNQPILHIAKKSIHYLAFVSINKKLLNANYM